MCRIEPIVNLNTGVEIGGEILCTTEYLSPELFFNSLSIIDFSGVLKQQIQSQKISIKNSNYIIFINVNLDLLLNLTLLESVISLTTTPKILEVDCEVIINHATQILRHIDDIRVILRNHNASIWIDDLYFRHIPRLIQIREVFDGIKIDKNEFWRIYTKSDTNEMNTLINRIRNFTDNILIEGVENTSQLKFIIDSNVDFAQGFYWPFDSSESFFINTLVK